MRPTLLLFVLLFSEIYLCGQTQVCGAPFWQKAGSIDNTQVVCPSDGTNSNVCLISVSFLKCIDALQSTHPAIRINPGDSVTWYSDQRDLTDFPNYSFYKIAFDDEFQQKGSNDYKSCLDITPGGDPNPFPDISKRTPAVKHVVRAKPKTGTLKQYTCFEHVVSLRDHNGKTVKLDPHVIIGDGTAYYAYLKSQKKR